MPSGSSNNPIAIPGPSVAANIFSWSPLGKREGEGGGGDGEETGQPSPKQQKLQEEQEEAPQKSEPKADEQSETERH